MKSRSIDSAALVETCAALSRDGWRLATIAVTDAELPELRYVFCGPRNAGWQQLTVRPSTTTAPANRRVPSLTPSNVAADWLEREIEDLFAIDFVGHPLLGDFVLHDNRWAEGVGPMRPGARIREGRVERAWQPRRVLREEGAFVMPVGPVYAGEAESALFLLETVGEDVVRTVPRLFYKYRGVEKLVQGRSVHDALLFVERTNGTSAFAHAWTYCMAAEEILGVRVPARAERLRAVFAELERVRRHVAAIRAIVDSTALWVGAARLLELEERLLRTCGAIGGHRYLFGITAVGGLQRDVEDSALVAAAREAGDAGAKVIATVEQLGHTSSFLDRIQRVGILTRMQAEQFGALGPFARASGVTFDLRYEQPYGAYATFQPTVPSADEGDGYARLRVLAEEIRSSLALIHELTHAIPPGPVRTAWSARGGEALGWAEAPGGASVQFLRLDAEARCIDLRFTPPSFRNWQNFRWVTEDFAFQDFPIILATCGLSVAENDR
jgi:formate hydrogenlyase subunit 5